MLFRGPLKRALRLRPFLTVAPILKFPDLLAPVYELSHHFKIFCLKKGAGGELVSGGREKWFTFHFCDLSDQIRQKFGGGVPLLLIPLLRTTIIIYYPG